ncbi:MAG: hypothetical protein PHC89_00115 [Candidatus Pacebacteria bacterium]|nr:hypothetical protein [Candidatus Paceibacterota bacterium]
MKQLLEQFTSYFTVPYAEAAMSDLHSFLGRLNDQIINPLIALAFAVALVYFVTGLFTFFKKESGSDSREKGKRHIVWGVIGMAVMISVFGIISFLTNTLGVGNVDPSSTGDISSLFN